MTAGEVYEVRPVGRVRSSLVRCAEAPKQGDEGAPEALVDVFEEYAAAVDGLSAGQDIIFLTWLHESQRTLLRVHPRDDRSRPLAGVFATRSADRPNPIGLHEVRLLAIDGRTLTVAGLEAIDSTPVLDIKPVLGAPTRVARDRRLPRQPQAPGQEAPSTASLLTLNLSGARSDREIARRPARVDCTTRASPARCP